MNKLVSTITSTILIVIGARLLQAQSEAQPRPLKEYANPMDEHALMAFGQPAACRHTGFIMLDELYGPSKHNRAVYKTTDAWLQLAGIDIYMANQWSSDTEQHLHVARVLENLNKDVA